MFESDNFAPPKFFGGEDLKEVLFKLGQLQEYVDAIQRDLTVASGGAASAISFDNTGTNLLATNVQDALMELDDEITILEGDVVPVGVIAIWRGLVADIPDGWVLCDGTNGTEDLSDKFIKGAVDDVDVDSTGGSVTLNTNGTGSHSHTITVNNHTLNTTRMPSHRHSYPASSSNTGAYGSADGDGNNFTDYTNYTGGSSGHNHSASSASNGSHAHTVADGRPPYHSKYYIQKI